MIQRASSETENMFDGIEKRLDMYMDGRVRPEEIASTFNYVLFDGFNKGGMNPVFVGEYKVDPSNPTQSRLFAHQGSQACSPIPLERGVIGEAVRSGHDLYVPDVTQHPNHVQCDAGMEGTEVVLLAWSKPYTWGDNGQRSHKTPVAALDIDLGSKNALSNDEVLRLKSIWTPWSRKIFPGEAGFQPVSGLHYVVKSRPAGVKVIGQGGQESYIGRD